MKKKILAVILSAMVALSLPTAIVAEAYYDFIDLDKKSSSNSNKNTTNKKNTSPKSNSTKIKSKNNSSKKTNHK